MLEKFDTSDELTSNDNLSDVVLETQSELRRAKLALEGLLPQLPKHDANNAPEIPAEHPAILADSPEPEANPTPNADTTAFLRDLFNDRACLTRARALLRGREMALGLPTFESDQEEEHANLKRIVRKITYYEAMELSSAVKLVYDYVNLFRQMDRCRQEPPNRNFDDMKKIVAQRSGWSVEKLSEGLTMGEKLEAVTGGHLGLMYPLPFQQWREEFQCTVDEDIYFRQLSDLQAGQAHLAKLDRLKDYCGMGMKLGAFLRGETEHLDDALREALDAKHDFKEMSQAEVEAAMNRLLQETCTCAN